MSLPVTIRRRVSGSYYLNTYFLTCTQTGETLIIDPGDSAEAVIAYIRLHQLNPVKVLATHGHADPLFSMEVFQQTHPIPYCIHEADDRFFKDSLVRKRTRLAVGLPPPPSADESLAHGDYLDFGFCSAQVIHTPGHTPGSACFLCQDRLFTGDTLFVGEAGRTVLPGGDLDQLIASIRDRILVLSPSTVLHPGHHHIHTPVQSTLAREMEENIYITDFILDP